jgi:hypothetical protein
VRACVVTCDVEREVYEWPLLLRASALGMPANSAAPSASASANERPRINLPPRRGRDYSTALTRAARRHDSLAASAWTECLLLLGRTDIPALGLDRLGLTQTRL